MNDKHIIRSRQALASLFCVLLVAVLLAIIFIPEKDFSEREKRSLASFPALSFSSVADGSFEDGLEKYLQDHFPLRNFFVAVGSYFDAATGRNGVDGVYHCDGYFIDEPVKYDEASLSRNLEMLKSFSQDNSLDSYMMIVPSAGYVLNGRLPRVHREYNDGDIIGKIYSDVAGCYKTVDICSVFNENKDNVQLYYKTDHHWTSGGAYLAYSRFMKAAGKAPVPADAFTVRSVPGFYGTTYSKAAMWLSKPDMLELWSIDGSSLSVTITDTGKKPVKYDSLFFESHLSEYDMYPTFLDGNHGLTVITNENVPGGSLLLLKDSYANTVATMLAQSFRTVVMADLRHYRTKAVSELIGRYGIDSMLVIYGVDNIVNDSNFVWLN